MKFYFGCIAVALFLSPTISLAQCSADPDNTFKPFKGGENNASGHFEWDSEAGPNHDKGGGHPDYAVERNVKNLAATTLKYRWAVGRLHNDALAGPTPDHNCYETTWPNQNAGPLDYGRGNDQTDTKVWEGSGEPKNNAIWASFTLNIATAGSVRTVSMRVLSSYSKISESSVSYNYLFESVSGGKITLKWGVDKDHGLVDKLKSQQMSPTLVVEGKKEISFTYNEPPTVGFRSLDVVIDGKDVAGVEVPMLIPRTSVVAQRAN